MIGFLDGHLQVTRALPQSPQSTLRLGLTVSYEKHHKGLRPLILYPAFSAKRIQGRAWGNYWISLLLLRVPVGLTGYC